jgi:hypothetical protein
MGLWRNGKLKMIGQNSDLQVELQGGLGNQLFQFANGVARSIYLDSTIMFNDSLLKKDQLRNFSLNYFGLKPNQSYKSEILEGALSFKTLTSKVVDQVEQVREENFHFTLTDEMLERNMNYSFYGYWQSHLNFSKIENYLRNFLLSFIPVHSTQNITVMHIRRGDFLSNKKSREYHGILGFDYYSRALSLLDSKTQEIQIISDDFEEIEGLINELESVFGKRFEIRSDLKHEMESLQLMAGSKQLIMANSSFSWWGAFLSNADRIIAPRNYFSKTTLRGLNVCDLYPEGWTLT